MRWLYAPEVAICDARISLVVCSVEHWILTFAAIASAEGKKKKNATGLSTQVEEFLWPKREAIWKSYDFRHMERYLRYSWWQSMAYLGPSQCSMSRHAHPGGICKHVFSGGIYIYSTYILVHLPSTPRTIYKSTFYRYIHALYSTVHSPPLGLWMHRSTDTSTFYTLNPSSVPQLGRVLTDSKSKACMHTSNLWHLHSTQYIEVCTE